MTAGKALECLRTAVIYVSVTGCSRLLSGTIFAGQSKVDSCAPFTLIVEVFAEHCGVM